MDKNSIYREHDSFDIMNKYLDFMGLYRGNNDTLMKLYDNKIYGRWESKNNKYCTTIFTNQKLEIAS